MADCTCINDLVIIFGLLNKRREAIETHLNLSMPCFLPPWHVNWSPGFSCTPSGQKHRWPVGFGRQMWLHPPFKREQLVVPEVGELVRK